MRSMSVVGETEAPTDAESSGKVSFVTAVAFTGTTHDSDHYFEKASDEMTSRICFILAGVGSRTCRFILLG